jgi:uncharacterized protein YggE
MSAFLSSRLAIGLLALFSLLTTVALTIGGISLTRAGIVSVLPVTSQQSGITVCGHGKATAKPDQARLSLGVFANAASAQDARNQAAQIMTNVLPRSRAMASAIRTFRPSTSRFSRNTPTRAARSASLATARPTLSARRFTPSRTLAK